MSFRPKGNDEFQVVILSCEGYPILAKGAGKG